ncbi:unnamed protein product [Symbiodinium sp. KB8]|nr:unnamed protein product [Symbiodinium sp. KB8]
MTKDTSHLREDGLARQQVLQNATLFKDILDSPDFEFSHLYKVITMLASKDLLEDTRSDRIYRLFLESNAMQACLRTTIIKQGAGRHHGNFLEECLKVMVEIVMRSAAPKELRGQLPLVELVEARLRVVYANCPIPLRAG